MIDIDISNDEIIYLTKNKDSWIKITYIPDNLKEYGLKNFNKMFMYHPIEKGKIIRNGLEKISDRYHISYLNTPIYDGSNDNYMYSGLFDIDNNKELPKEFQKYYEYIQSQDFKYNQVIVNWFEDGNNYIPNHVDCNKSMVDNYKIMMLTLNKTGDNKMKKYRKIVIKSRGKYQQNCLYDKLCIILKHGMLLEMCGLTNKYFRHGIPKIIDENIDPRISLSFRQINTENKN